jgi:murein L,D-transpeptidase YafK
MMPRTHVWNVVLCGMALVCAADRVAAQGPSANFVASNATSERSAAPARSSFNVLETSFAREQLRHNRVRAAHLRASPKIHRMFVEKGIAYPAAEMFVRVFKRERQLEVWVRPQGESRFQHLKTWGICGMAGKPGPKRQQGDMQVPEGFYAIDLFNPSSSYHLSLRVNYPNERDVAVNRAGLRLGGDIYIHGGCKSEGCLAISDGGIEELYWLSVEARALGQREIPIHIFPARIDAAEIRRLGPIFADQPGLVEFWETLRPGYEYFEKHHRLPQVTVDAKGRYRIARHES